MNLQDLKIDESWTLFLDRDGVINKRKVGDYIRTPDEFVFLDGVPEAISLLNDHFGLIIVVTNQQGVGKGLMKGEDVERIHTYMMESLSPKGAFMDVALYCPGLAIDNPECRKPNPGMAYQAKEFYPDINFSRSLMVGDMESDIGFARNAGMWAVLANPAYEKVQDKWERGWKPDLCVRNLAELASMINP